MIPNDAQEACLLVTRQGSSRIIEFRDVLCLKLNVSTSEIRGGINLERFGARARLYVPLSKDLLRSYGMGDAEWRDQFELGFPILGGPTEPGVYLLSSEVA